MFLPLFDVARHLKNKYFPKELLCIHSHTTEANYCSSLIQIVSVILKIMKVKNVVTDNWNFNIFVMGGGGR